MWRDQGSWSTQDWAPERKVYGDSSAALQRVHLELLLSICHCACQETTLSWGRNHLKCMEEKAISETTQSQKYFPFPKLRVKNCMSWVLIRVLPKVKGENFPLVKHATLVLSNKHEKYDPKRLNYYQVMKLHLSIRLKNIYGNTNIIHDQVTAE